MIQRGLVFCVSLLISAHSMAQGTKHNVSLKSLLQDIEFVSASFTQTVFDGPEAIYEASGKLYLAKPGKVRWETESPDEALMIADGQSIWNVDSFVEQVTVFDQQSAVENNPIILLTSQDEAVWQQFDIRHINEQVRFNGSDVSHGFLIEAKSEDAQIDALTLYFDQSIIVGMSTLDAQGQLSQLVFSNINMTNALSKDLFEVNIPDSYTIDDQR